MKTNIPAATTCIQSFYHAYRKLLIFFTTHSLLTYFLKSKSNVTLLLYETTATRVLAENTEKYSRRLITNLFSAKKLYSPTRREESSKNTRSNLVFLGPGKENNKSPLGIGYIGCLTSDSLCIVCSRQTANMRIRKLIM